MSDIPGNYFDAYKGSDPFLFTSYAHKDSEIVYSIINSLHDMGYNIWYDAPGYVIETSSKAGEPIDLSVNDRVVAKGKVVVIDESFGVRIIEIFKEKFKQIISGKNPIEIASDSHNTLNNAEPKHNEAPNIKSNIEQILDVPMAVTIEIGKTVKSIKDILEFAPGSILELDRLAGEPVDILANNKYCAKGEVVVVDEYFGVRITEIVHLPALKD